MYGIVRTYACYRVVSYKCLYNRYMEDSKVDPEGRIKIPQDLLGGKDSIIFGNIRDLYEFHKK